MSMPIGTCVQTVHIKLKLAVTFNTLSLFFNILVLVWTCSYYIAYAYIILDKFILFWTCLYYFVHYRYIWQSSCLVLPFIYFIYILGRAVKRLMTQCILKVNSQAFEQTIFIDFIYQM